MILDGKMPLRVPSRDENNSPKASKLRLDAESSHGWLKPNRAKARERASSVPPPPDHPASTAGPTASWRTTVKRDSGVENMRVTRLNILWIVLCFAVGCNRQDTKPAEITKSEAIKAAEAHLRTKGRLSQPYDVDATVNDDGEWSVLFKFLPRTPGRHTGVIVDKNGTVLRTEPGA